VIVVADTNVLVPAMLSPYGAPARILELAIARELQLAYDDRILVEYEQVLNRPKFGFDPQDVADILAALVENGVAVLARPMPQALPDLTDQAFVEVAREVDAPLITGNVRHFPSDLASGVLVLSPARFLEYWWQYHEDDPG